MITASLKTTLTRFGAAAFIAAAMLSTSFVAPSSANVEPGGFQGVVLVPPGTPDAKQVKAYEDNFGFKRAKIVAYKSSLKPGSIVVNTQTNRLYYILGNGKAAMYRIASGKPGFEWAGQHRISSKVKWPDWRPPEAMRKRKPELPAYMAGGPKNPLGARAMYLGSSIYRIHGTNEPSSIGKHASSGCIRMLNADVSELYAHAKIGALVVVM
jgi:lipoprotein-anchoring transpeptidase ErfK/SrfK